MQQSLRKFYILPLVTAVFLSGCAAGGDRLEGADETVSDLDYNGSDCILIRTIRDYTPLDRQHLLVRGPGRRSYFVTLLRPAFELRGAMGFRVESRDDQLCPFGGDEIVFGSFGSERIPVRAISRLTADQEEQLLIRYGIEQPAESETPAAPEEVPAADVEELG